MDVQKAHDLRFHEVRFFVGQPLSLNIRILHAYRRPPYLEGFIRLRQQAIYKNRKRHMFQFGGKPMLTGNHHDERKPCETSSIASHLPIASRIISS